MGLDVVGFNGNLTYKRRPTFPAYTLKVQPVDLDPAENIGADYIDDISLSTIVDAGVRTSGKSFALTVKAATNVSEDQVRKKIDAVIGDGMDYKRDVFEKLPNQENTACMGGMGVSAGYHYHLPLLICNVRGGIDYLWGKFKPLDLYPSSLAQLGWGFKAGVGLDYKLTDKATFGFEGGARFSAFRNPQIDQSSTKTSWFALPYFQAVCGFSPYPDYGISVFVGYFLPAKFSINTNGGTIPNDTTCKVDGMFGGLRFARYF